jgi:hypothetical protein
MKLLIIFITIFYLGLNLYPTRLDYPFEASSYGWPFICYEDSTYISVSTNDDKDDGPVYSIGPDRWLLKNSVYNFLLFLLLLSPLIIIKIFTKKLNNQ